MSPWLFNMNMKEMERIWLGVDGRRWKMCQIMSAHDTALVVDSVDKLQKLVEESGRVFERRKLKVNVNKGDMMHCSQ